MLLLELRCNFVHLPVGLAVVIMTGAPVMRLEFGDAFYGEARAAILVCWRQRTKREFTRWRGVRANESFVGVRNLKKTRSS